MNRLPRDSGVACDIVVIGGGAAGIVAAISARRAGASVLVCERMSKACKKLRVSGNGRCNLSNDVLAASCYNPEAGKIVESVFARFGKQDILRFFRQLGLRVTSEKGRVFPVTNQAASVIDALEFEAARSGVEIRCNCEAVSCARGDRGFAVGLKGGGTLHAAAVILCGGGKSYPVSGSDGNAYALASGFGHHLIEPVPSAVPLVVKDPWCAALDGQKIRAAVRCRIGKETGGQAEGELLFTAYGLSGSVILDLGEGISIAVNRARAEKVELVVDLVPYLHEEELRKELSWRLRKNFPPEKLLMGLLPHKFAGPLGRELETRDPRRIASMLKGRIFRVDGTRGWDEAEFTSGGIDTREVDPHTLESRLCSGLYLAGEILDVQGKRGGYNLAWAWASGFVAGASAAGR